MTAARRKFTQEFKDELCLEVINTSKPIKDVATAYGVGPETLSFVIDRAPRCAAFPCRRAGQAPRCRRPGRAGRSVIW